MTEVRALLTCDLAFPQAATGSWHVIGIHDRLVVRELPATHTSLVVFWSLSDFAGNAMVMVTIRTEAGAVVYAMRASIPELPARAIEQAFAFPPVTFKDAGGYVVELHVADELLALRSFHVHLVPQVAGG